MLSTNDFISVDEMVAEVSLTIMDEELKLNGRTYYAMLVHRAVEALAIESFFQIVTKDIFDWNCNGNFMFDLPANAFNLREMVFFNLAHQPAGQCQCTENNTSKQCWGAFKIAHFKSHYNSFGSTEIRTAKIAGKGGPHDAVYEDYYRYSNKNMIDGKGMIYFGIQNGTYTISNEAGTYKHVRIVYNGMGSDNDKLPCIPRVFRQAIIDYSVEKATRRLKVKYPNMRVIWSDSLQALNGDNRTMGSWERAKRFAKGSDKKVNNDYQEYLANPMLK